MKKKIIMLAAVLMMFAGVASGSSINGDYKGNPIVKLLSNGSTVDTGEVPAMIYDGKTMVPIAALRNLGAEVTWDANTYSVNVVLNNSNGQDQIADLKLFASAAKSTLQQNNVTVNQISANIDEHGIFVYAQYDVSNDNTSVENVQNKLLPKLGLIGISSTLLNKYNVDGTVIELTSGGNTIGTIGIKNSDSQKYINNELTFQQYFATWNVSKNQSIIPQQYTVPSQVTSDVIESKIEGDFEGFDEGNIYKLDNGQIWEQTDYTYSYSYKYRPDVTIYEDGYSYVMMVEGMDKKVKVKRIK
ncbi:hypothetical protein JCM16163A_41530 [Paenibacillus sp. YK5]